jgi:hypothetical protein
LIQEVAKADNGEVEKELNIASQMNLNQVHLSSSPSDEKAPSQASAK